MRTRISMPLSALVLALVVALALGTVVKPPPAA
jgi:hypothetical protein